MRFTITPLGGAGRAVRLIANDIVSYLMPGHGRSPTPQRAPSPSTLSVRQPEPGDEGITGSVRYYADSGEPGRWSGQGAEALGLQGTVRAEDFAKVLAGRDPDTGARLISAQGSAGRRPKLGAGTATQLGPDGEPLYDARDAAVLLDLPQKQLERMLDVGSVQALTGCLLRPGPSQPASSFLTPFIDSDGNRWVTNAEIERCQEALDIGPTGEEVAASGPPEEQLPLPEAARLAGVTRQYLGRLALRYETEQETIEATLAKGETPRLAYLVASRDARGHWHVTRRELAAFLKRRRPPAVRVAYDLTLTTEKSLGVLALLSDARTGRAVLEAVGAGNDWAMAWLETHAAAARVKEEVVPVKGWMAASFRHETSRALDPFPHIHNIVANTVECLDGDRRALDARGLYWNAQAASALSTAEMRDQLTRRLGVRWRPAAHGGWEIAGIPEEALREFSRRRGEIEDALRELEEILGRGVSPEDVDHISVTTRPAKTHVLPGELLDDWWRRAGRLGFSREHLADCVGPEAEPPEPDTRELFEALAAPDGICANLSIFNRSDVLNTLVNWPLPAPQEEASQPLIVSAERLEELADEFLRSYHVEVLTEDEDDPGRVLYSTIEILVVQDRIVNRYRDGLDTGSAQIPPQVINETLGRHSDLTPQQRELVRSFCASGHRVQCAVGHPGAGKTTAMAAAREAWEAAGWTVLGAAVKGQAARTLGATAGITTETLAWYLAHDDPMRAPLDARTVLIVDEASTVSDRDLDQLGWLVDQTGATLRLVGDPAQHGAVEAGGMFRVLTQRYKDETPKLTGTHRLQDPHDRAAARLLRKGKVTEALHELHAAGHLHIVEDEVDAYTDVLARWWQAHQAGQLHPMVNQRNDVRRTLNRLAHTLLRAAGDIGTKEIVGVEDRRYSIGDRVIARAPARSLHPVGQPGAYIRNGAVGTVVSLRHGDTLEADRMTVDFDDIGPIEIPRSFFDQGQLTGSGRHDVGIDHGYAVTSYAATGSTWPVSTSRIDETASRAETYVDITRGQQANHLYLTRAADPLDGEYLPREPPVPLSEAVAQQLAGSRGERTAWEIREDQMERQAKHDAPTRPDGAGLAL